jgi:hypothetical protein
MLAAPDEFTAAYTRPPAHVYNYNNTLQRCWLTNAELQGRTEL